MMGADSPPGARIRRAVLPAAGKGTRMRDLRGDGPKELLPVAGLPMLVHGLIDLARSGIDEIFIVVAPDKPEIREHCERLPATLDRGSLAPWRDVLQGCSVQFPVQPAPQGLADAIACAGAFTRDEPFVCYLPDNIFAGPTPATAQVLEAYGACGHTTVALAPVRADTAATFGTSGRVVTKAFQGSTVRIHRLADKGHAADTGGWSPGYRACGLSVLTPEFMEISAGMPANSAGEQDDVPVFQELIGRGRLFGRQLDSTCYDAGHPVGYAAADAALAAPPPPHAKPHV